MRVLVPFSLHRPKSRLSDVLDPQERESLARAMLADVLEAVALAGGRPVVLATEEMKLPDASPTEGGESPDASPTEGGESPDASPTDGVNSPTDPTDPSLRVDDRDLTVAVNAALDEFLVDEGADAAGVVMADLPLSTPRALRGLFDADGDVVIAAGRGGGTNALVVRDPAFRVDYHGASYLDHRRIAAGIDAAVTEIDSRRLATDVDEPADLAELLVHGEGRAAHWLREAGFRLDTSDGRVAVVRE